MPQLQQQPVVSNDPGHDPGVNCELVRKACCVHGCTSYLLRSRGARAMLYLGRTLTEARESFDAINEEFAAQGLPQFRVEDRIWLA